MPHAGFAFLQSSNEKLQVALGSSGVSPRLKAHASYNTGYIAGVSLGYIYSNCSFELDYNYAHNELYKTTTEFNVSAGQKYHLYGGYMDANILLLNGFYSFRKHCQLRPYLGGGLGAAWLKSEQILTQPFFDGTTVNDSVFRFAYHLRLGLKYCLTQTVTSDFYYGFYNVVRPILHDTQNNSFHFGYYLNTINFGLSYNF